MTCQERSSYQVASDGAPTAIVSAFGNFMQIDLPAQCWQQVTDIVCGLHLSTSRSDRQIFDNIWKKDHNTIV
jgi:hypothetical protein